MLTKENCGSLGESGPGGQGHRQRWGLWVCQGVTQSPASLQCNKGGGEYWEMRSDRELGTIAFITLKAKVNLEFSDLPMFCPLLWVASA